MSLKRIAIALCCLAVALSTGGTAATVTPSVLNSNPALFDGSRVTVRGFLNLGPEAHGLFESKALNDKFGRRWDSGKDFDPKIYDKYCLTIANPDIFLDNERAFAGRTVEVSGRFVAKYQDGTFVDPGACALPTAIVVDVDDLKRRHPTIFHKR